MINDAKLLRLGKAYLNRRRAANQPVTPADPPALSAAQIELLACLIEECAEVSRAAAKVLRHGYESPRTNRDDLERELGDLSCVAVMIEQTGDILGSRVDAAADEKFTRIFTFLHHNHESDFPA